MSALDAMLFDLGGTLDGRGGWRDRFHRLLTDAGLSCSRDQRGAAFDYADARSHAAGEMPSARLRDMVTLHVGWQLESLGRSDESLVSTIAARFVRDVEDAAAVNRRVLAGLAAQGIKIGVVSNACGNAAILCDEYGYTSFLSVVVDSHKFGASKPDPSIFRHALEMVGVPAERTGFVGDSLDHDIAPAKALGMRTFWIANPAVAVTPSAADAVIESLADLPAALLQFDLRAV